jgi:N-acetylglucosamine-6-phosphate deacetylase
MIVLSGAALVLPDRILSPGTLVIDGDRIAEIRPDTPSAGPQSPFAFHGHYILPGFIDVHMHGADGVDTLDEGDPVAALARQLPRYGVTGFCPTTVACAPDALRHLLDCVRSARETPMPRSARVLPAHLESNFVNPEYRGAQPAACLRSPSAALARRADDDGGDPGGRSGEFAASDILREIERAAPDVGIVTLAPELDGGLDLIRWLVSRGHRVSLGHSNASYEEARAAIAAGAQQATHLFNRMPPLHHRAPGLAGAVLETEEVAAEIICDGVHVHPALVQAAIAAKRPPRVLAITDATALAGLPAGARSRIGGRTITARAGAALLEDGTIAGSTLTMDRAFQMLVGRIGLSILDAAIVCATTPARELGLAGCGLLASGAMADLVVLDANFEVIQTYVAGQLVYTRNTGANGTV